MTITAQQLKELYKMPVSELKTVHSNIKKHTKKLSNKEDLTREIQEVVSQYNNFRCELSKKYNCVLKPREISDYSKFTSIDLRQVHTNFRQALICKKYTKTNIINSLIRLGKIIDYFIQY